MTAHRGSPIESLSTDDPDSSQDKSARSHRADHLAPFQWKPGQSGNPSGKTKMSAAVRRRARHLADDTLDAVEAKLKDPDCSLSDLIQAAKFLTSMGGILAPDQLVQIESAYSRLMLQIADSQRLSEEQKTKAISQVDEIHREALGESDE